MKTHIYLSFICMLTSAGSCFAEDINFYNYSVGLNYQYLSVKDSYNAASEAQFEGGNGHAFGVFYKGEPHEYMQFSMGIDYMMVDDAAPFAQTVKNEITGDISVRKSDVSGFGIYAETGLMYKPSFMQNLSFGLLGGYRYNNIERAIIQCDACNAQALKDFDSSIYGKVFVELQLTSEMHLQLNYVHFLSDTGFDNSIGAQLSFFAF